MSIETNNPEPSSEVTELLDQFKDVSYQTFQTALARTISEDMHPILDDKPVNLLRFSVERSHMVNVSELNPNPIVQETLYVGVRKPAEKSGNNTQPPVRAGYHATHVDRIQDEKTTDLSVFSYEVPQSNELESVSNISMALFYARDALAYVTSQNFDRPRHGEQPGLYVPGSRGDDALESMRHSLGFNFTPDLGPFLNGHEGQMFLREYQRKMKYEYTKACYYLDKARQANMSDTAAAEAVTKYETALLRVNDLLIEKDY